MDFEALANEHKDAVYRQLIRACGNREDAEDVLVEALLKAYRNLGQLRDSAAFRSRASASCAKARPARCIYRIARSRRWATITSGTSDEHTRSGSGARIDRCVSPLEDHVHSGIAGDI